MVLINELTVEQINAALLHLQRSKDEVVGGNKGTTIQNITISNSGGGGNNVDYSGTIKNLATNIEKNKTAIEKNASDIAKLKSDMANIEKSVEDTLQGLVDNGISDLSFDPLTKQLTITTNDGDIYQAVIEQDIGYLSYDSATNKLILTTGNQSQEITLPYILSSEKGSANGVATLDENGRVPYSQLPESAMEFLGQWNASTNTPHLADGTGTNGDFYIVSAGGTVNLGTAQDPHIVTFSVNDRIVYEGDIAQWVRLPAGQVSSVNGQSGEVTLTASDIEYSTGVSIKAKIDSNAVQSDWGVSDTTSLAYIKNKPTIPEAQVQSDWAQTCSSCKSYIQNKPSLATVATSGKYCDLTGKPTIPASPVQSDWNVTDTTSLAYIKNKPTIPSSPVQSDWNVTDTTSLAYIKNKPSVAVLGNTEGCGLGTASAGSCTTAARSDHVHPLPICVQNAGCACNAVYAIHAADAGCACNAGYACMAGYALNATDAVCADWACNADWATAANTIEGYHADVASASNLIRVTKGSDVGSKANGYYAGMTCLDAGDGATKWWHILSMDGNGNDANNWQSQFLLPTQQGGVPKYRRNNAGGTAITSSTWHKFYTDENRQAIFDLVHPVGEIYVQYPGSKTPAEIYNIANVIASTWTEQSYSGAFFRASGGNASAFITGTTYTQQPQATAVNGLTVNNNNNLSGTVGRLRAMGTWSTSGIITSEQNSKGSYGGSSTTYYQKTLTINANHGHTMSGDTETRPANLTIRIWKRTA